MDLRVSGDRAGSDFRIVMRDVGALQVLLGGFLLLPLLVSLLYGEIYSALSFLVTAAVTAGFGVSAYRACREAGDPTRRHAMLIAALGWLISAGFGALPFLLAAYWTPPEVAQAFVPAGERYASSLVHFRNPLHAFFESMSAFTTTGLTMAVHEPSIGHGLLFYRSLGQWIGGAGVVVLSLAIIPRPHVVGELELYQSETAGMKLRPSVLGTARAIWKIYAAMTLLVTVYLFLMTLLILPDYGWAASLFDAVNHAMTAQSTGGFSTLDDSIAGYRSYAMDLVHIPPMILGAISIPLYYAFLRTRKVNVFWKDPQFRFMILLFGTAIPVLVLLLQGTPAVSDSLREGIFQVVSGVSTTGWQTSNIAGWGNSAVLLLAWGAMIVGGSAGATVGGIKLVRAYLFLRAIAWRIRKVFLPGDAVIPFRIGERSLATSAMQREVAEAAIFSCFYLIILSGAVLVAAHQLGSDIRLADIIFECVSAQSTVGLSTGVTDPGMPVSVELLFIFQMWVGRLEIFPVIVLLTAPFSRRGRR
ncbi:MAG: TrkH family potassium uptake protein [Planctomycetes bacterium]|nr:TrkH family potassium uptake protein [Planctomycetota bacterium]